MEYGKGLPAKERDDGGTVPVYGSNGIVGTHKDVLVHQPCVIIGRKGSSGAVNLSLEPCWVIDTAYFVVPPDGLDLLFTYRLLRSLHLENLGKGIKPGLTRSEAYDLILAVPPLAEQKRIVAKVDELFAQTRALEARLRQAQADVVTANRAALHRLHTAQDDGQFQAAWRTLRDHFDVLYDDPRNVAELRQSILDLAVRGKLVAQDTKDEPATELLETIEAEKQRLAAQGKFRGDTKAHRLGRGDMPFELPRNWVWTRLGAITISRDGERIPVSKEERSQRAKTYDYYGASGVIDKIDGFLFDKPLLLIGEDGANLINRSTPIAFIARGRYWVNNHAHVLDGISEQFLRYLELHINAIDLKPYVTGTAQPKMNQTKMNGIPIALPPLAEQQRIVAKVDQLMRLCDALEAGLVQAESQRRKLVAAVLQT
jgi:type I restriction enzyme S subunit